MRTPPSRPPIVSVTPATPATIGPPDLAVVMVVDRYPGLAAQVTAAKQSLAAAMDALIVPGRGSIIVHVLGIGRDSYDPRNEFLSFRTDAVPAAPAMRPTIPRPSEPDLSVCDRIKSTRARCISRLQAQHETQMQRALNDEALAKADYDAAAEQSDVALSQAKAAVGVQTDQLRNLAIPPDDAAWDVDGALLRAGQLLAGSGAKVRVLMPVTDFVSGGPASNLQTLDLKGVSVRSVWYVCHSNATTCLQREASYRDLMTRDGAASVEFLDPAASVVLPTVLEGVMP
jgi:hypothetical protein